MIISAGWSKKSGRPNYSSDCVSCSVELDIPDDLAADPAKLREQIRKLHETVYHAVEDELTLRAPEPAREAGSDDDDVRPGDPAYDRRPAQADDRGSYGDRDDDYDRQIDEAHQRGNGDRRDDRRPPERRDDRRPAPQRDDRRQGGGSGKRYGRPTNARRFGGWFQSLNDTDEGRRIKKEVVSLMKSWNYPTFCGDLTDDQAVDLYDEIERTILPPESPPGSWGGPPRETSRNSGYSGDRVASRNGNGRR
jgi:hypothetical protein